MRPGGSPFQACYLLLNKSAAGDRTQSVDGQRARERQGKGAYCYPLWRGGGGGGGEGVKEGEGWGGGDAVGLFKTPCLWEDLLSLRPVTMETGPAQCRGEGRGARGRYHGNTSCHGNSSDGGGRAGSRSFKETGAPSISWWRVLFFSHTRTSCFIYLTRKSHDGDALDKTIGSREEGQ